MKIKVQAQIEIPRVPNFLKMQGGQTIPVSAITEEGLREIGQRWTEALIARANEQSKDDT
jgi:hypothetical protein